MRFCVPARRRAQAAVFFVAAAASAPLVAQELAVGTRADLVIVHKSERTLSLYWRNRPLKTYKVALGSSPMGPKEREGDARTPEGTYVIDSRNPNSAFHRSRHISYPNAQDRRRARQLNVSPGGDIMIHGLPNGMAAMGKAHVLRDWTLGCIAVTNAEIEEIWRVVPNGTRVDIKP